MTVISRVGYSEMVFQNLDVSQILSIKIEQKRETLREEKKI